MSARAGVHCVPNLLDGHRRIAVSRNPHDDLTETLPDKAWAQRHPSHPRASQFRCHPIARQTRLAPSCGARLASPHCLLISASTDATVCTRRPAILSRTPHDHASPAATTDLTAHQNARQASVTIRDRTSFRQGDIACNDHTARRRWSRTSRSGTLHEHFKARESLHMAHFEEQVDRPTRGLQDIEETAGQIPFATGPRIATHSTCEVIGNRSNARIRRGAYPASAKYLRSRARAAGSQAT